MLLKRILFNIIFTLVTYGFEIENFMSDKTLSERWLESNLLIIIESGHYDAETYIRVFIIQIYFH